MNWNIMEEIFRFKQKKNYNIFLNIDQGTKVNLWIGQTLFRWKVTWNYIDLGTRNNYKYKNQKVEIIYIIKQDIHIQSVPYHMRLSPLYNTKINP